MWTGGPAQLLAQMLTILRRLADAASSWQGGQAASELHALLQNLVAEVANGQGDAGDGGIASAGRWFAVAVVDTKACSVPGYFVRTHAGPCMLPGTSWMTPTLTKTQMMQRCHG